MIEAAGGLVWRQTPEGVEVLLVHRPRYDDWTLPIGRLEPGERREECAVREVAEETGYRCLITGRGFLDTLTVAAADGVHRFHIYEMEPVDGGFVPNPETDRAEWFALADAITTATYPNVRALLAATTFSERRPRAGGPRRPGAREPSGPAS